MQPMRPMKPMEPMAPAEPAEAWWPQALGRPDASGSQDGLRYGYFAAARRLAVRRADGQTVLYDTGEHRISGMAQGQRGEDQNAEFTSQRGTVSLADLRTVQA